MCNVTDLIIAVKYVMMVSVCLCVYTNKICQSLRYATNNALEKFLMHIVNVNQF